MLRANQLNLPVHDYKNFSFYFINIHYVPQNTKINLFNGFRQKIKVYTR